MIKIGFIGAGNMGGAIISGMVKSGTFDAKSICVCDKNISPEISALGTELADIATLTNTCGVIVLAVKPNMLSEVARDICTSSSDLSEKLFVSIAAGVKLEKLAAMINTKKIIRVMPNLCLKASEGMCVLCRTADVSDEELSFGEKIFGCSGKTAVLKEELIDACTAINGSGPAYVFMFMEAMADAAVKHGIDRKTAYTLSAQTVLGSAAMMLATSLHPGVLKDMVCSPGGTTIEAVQALEDAGLRSAVMAAVDACVQKAENMGN